MRIKFNYTILLASFFCLSGLSSFSQEMIDEDFLDNIDKNVKVMWDENAPDFASTTTPATYNNESAVIIGYKRSVAIDKQSKFGLLSKGERSLLFMENVRFKIKLNDNNAVQNFSTIYFRYNDKADGFGAKVIKEDGTVTNVMLNEAIGIESTTSMPEFFKSFFDQESGNQRRYYKVAISNLEPGDILEYVTVTKNKLDVKSSGYIEFSPQYELCNKNYPILYNQISIETDNKSFFKSLSKNGAPEFVKENSGESGFHRFVFTDKNRGVEKDVNFIQNYKVFPYVKFQVIYANNENTKGALIGSKGEIKSGFTKEELAKKAWEDYVLVGKAYYENYWTVQDLVDNAWSELKKLGAKDWTEKEYITKSYYKVRNLVVNRSNYLSDKTAAFIFGSLLYQRDIKSDLIISISNSIGNINDVLFDEEIRYVCKVNDKLYFNCTDYSNPEELVESLLASDAYIIAAPGKGGVQDIKPFKLPTTTNQDNVVSFTMEAILSADLHSLSVRRVSAYKGLSKARAIATALRYNTYMIDDYKYYGANSPTEKMKDAQEEEYFKSVKALKDRFKEATPDYVKKQLQNEFNQDIKYKNYVVNTDGRSLKTTDLNFTEEFEMHGVVRKAGKKLLINIPGLVGSQLQIKKEERIRKHDIYIGLPRTLNWVISFKIPDGYTVEGLKELNISKDNNTGLFSCVAEEKDGKVILKIQKVYKEIQFSKDSWANMLDVIDAAFNNSYKYILLKPKT